MTTGSVFVPGTPVPQGSTRAFVVAGHAVTTGANPKTKPWRADIAAVVREYIGPGILFPAGAVSLKAEFVMPRRVAEPKRSTPPHTRKPDGDKLLRSLCDALSGLVYTDDSQVTDIHASKRTAEIGEQPGALITWTGDEFDE